jgi:D-alanyl-lipoteichoic acid acyltransferase DltB (MBOAT superfamily)
MYRNLMLTMLLGGLWHGANWTFVAWGGLHGTALVIHKAWIGRRPVEQRPRVPWRILSWGGTMLLVGVAWVFFRAPDFSTATKILTGIAALRGPFELRQLAPALVPTAIVLFIDLPQARRGEHEAILRWPLVPRTLTYVALVVAILLLRTGHDVPFIYFQF